METGTQAAGMGEVSINVKEHSSVEHDVEYDMTTEGQI